MRFLDIIYPIAEEEPLYESKISIEHFYKLPPDKLLDVIKNISKFEFTEKIDGVGVRIGRNEEGDLIFINPYRGDKVYKDPSEWEAEMGNTGFRSAHKALVELDKRFDNGIPGLNPGDEISVEIIYGLIPNAVPYSREKNYIVPLNAEEGNPDLEQIKSAIDGEKVVVQVDDVPFTIDGKSKQERKESHLWQFTGVPKLSQEDIENTFSSAALKDELYKLEQWLKTNPKITKKELQKGETYPILKKLILDLLVRPRASALGMDKNQGGRIEGYVARDPETGEMIKFVDVDEFRNIASFLRFVRNSISPKPKSAEADKESLYGSTLIKIATLLGSPTYATIFGSKRLEKELNEPGGMTSYLKSIQDTYSPEHLIDEIKNIIEKSMVDLERLRKEYIEAYRDLQYEYDRGDSKEKIKYDEQTHEKTLEEFYRTRENLKELYKNLLNSDTLQDLVVRFIKVIRPNATLNLQEDEQLNEVSKDNIRKLMSIDFEHGTELEYYIKQNKKDFKFLGDGLYATVWGSNGSPVVLKVVVGDHLEYKKYYDLSMTNRDNPHFPRFSKMHRILPDGSGIYFMQKLQPMPASLSSIKFARDINSLAQEYLFYEEVPQELQYIIDNFPKMLEWVKKFTMVFKNENNYDIGGNNIMMRGKIPVMTDPIAESSL